MGATCMGCVLKAKNLKKFDRSNSPVVKRTYIPGMRIDKNQSLTSLRIKVNAESAPGQVIEGLPYHKPMANVFRQKT